MVLLSGLGRFPFSLLLCSCDWSQRPPLQAQHPQGRCLILLTLMSALFSSSQEGTLRCIKKYLLNNRDRCSQYNLFCALLSIKTAHVSNIRFLSPWAECWWRHWMTNLPLDSIRTELNLFTQLFYFPQTVLLQVLTCHCLGFLKNQYV